MLTSAWLSGFMADDIRNGKLSVWLARPGSYLYELAANNISEKVLKLVILVPMVAVFRLALPGRHRVTDAAWHWGVAALAIVLGAVHRLFARCGRGLAGILDGRCRRHRPGARVVDGGARRAGACRWR